jgi:hypothetical protein
MCRRFCSFRVSRSRVWEKHARQTQRVDRGGDGRRRASHHGARADPAVPRRGPARASDGGRSTRKPSGAGRFSRGPQRAYCARWGGVMQTNHAAARSDRRRPRGREDWDVAVVVRSTEHRRRCGGAIWSACGGRFAAANGRQREAAGGRSAKTARAMARYDAAARWGELANVPSLVLSATHDRIALPAYGRKLAALSRGRTVC